MAKPTINSNWLQCIVDFPMKNGDFPMNNGDFPMKHGDFP